MDEEGERRQISRLNRVRQERSNGEVQRTLAGLRSAAEETENLMPYIMDAIRAYATVGKVYDTMRDVFGEYEARFII